MGRKRRSKMVEDDLVTIHEDETEVFASTEVEDIDLLGRCGVNGLHDFSHRIDDFEKLRRVADPTEKINLAYIARESAAQETKEVMDEESQTREALQAEIQKLESKLQAKIEKESGALDTYRDDTNRVMCLEMEEPCRWNSTYQQLKSYVMRTGDLPPAPCACGFEVDRRLSIWVQEMKSLVYSKSKRIVNAPHRIEALESLGIEWIEFGEDRWNSMYGKLVAYMRRHGTVKLPSFMQCRKSKDKDLTALRHWVDVQEVKVKSGAMAKRRDRLKKLQNLGLPWKLTWEQEWDHYMVELLKFRSKYAHLNVGLASSPSGNNAYSDLSEFTSQLLERLKKSSMVKLTKDELRDLGAKGLLRDFKSMAQCPPGRPSTSGNRGGDILRLIPLERVKEVNYWAGMLEQLKFYQAQTGKLTFPPHKGGDPSTREGNNDFAHLRDWVEVQRANFQNKTLEGCRIKELQNLGFEFDPWHVTFDKLRKYKREAGTVRLPREYNSSESVDESDDQEKEDVELNELCKWVQDQIRLYRKGQLEIDRKKKLRKLGVKLTKGHMGKVPWEDRFEEMMEYYHSHKTCLPKRDGPLREWILELVNLIQNGYVSNRRQKRIDQERIGPYLRPEVIFKGISPTIPPSSSEGKKKRKADLMAQPSDENYGDGAKKAKTEVMAV